MPQPCDVDLEVWGDFEAAASTDALAKAIDYSRLADRTLETAHSREYNLIETLAYAVARAVLSGFPASRVRVRVRKRPASLCEKLDYVEAEVTES
jgi:dihydroneopterin aldolase